MYHVVVWVRVYHTCGKDVAYISMCTFLHSQKNKVY